MILDQLGGVCFTVAGWCFTTRERISTAALADEQQKAIYRLYTPTGALLYVSRQQGQA